MENQTYYWKFVMENPIEHMDDLGVPQWLDGL